MIPPFPSQDLAKLVLGYLAEEQLMTAYDEFLQASPYLDAFSNEYDRIFMTSLKKILSEYRAVKIYVETCKPFSLRKKLFQCSNLLEVVKFLVRHIDINKLHMQDDNMDNLKKRVDTQNFNTSNRCELCITLNRISCVCNSKLSIYQDQSMNQVKTSSLESLVETTSLADLPGNHGTAKKKHVKLIEKDSNTSKLNSNCGQHNVSILKQYSHLNNTNIEQNLLSASSHNLQMKSNQSDGINVTIKRTDILESSQKIEEFNDILKIVCNDSSKRDSNSYENVESKKNSITGTFPDFAIGVNGGETSNINVPDSSTSENMQIPLPIKEQSNRYDMKSSSNSIKGPINNDCVFDNASLLRPTPEDHKITILSDIKVDNSSNIPGHMSNTHIKIPSVPKNATSTPLLQMQTILLNGTPARKPSSQIGQRYNFTKDEIMAMPTLILVPTSGSSQICTSSQSQAKFFQNTTVTTNVNTGIATAINSSIVPSLGPLTIDVSSNNLGSGSTKTNFNNTNVITHEENKVETETCLIKTVDVSKNASAPKDNIPFLSDSSTPQVIPPVRKSSSTPRRNSHVRVLDFTTPRRILHETINEHVSNQNCESPVEVIINGNPNIAFSELVNTENTDDCEIRVNVDNNNTGSTKENNVTNKITLSKKHNWDADLRALVGPIDSEDKSKISSKSKSKAKSKNSKQKKLLEKQHETIIFERETSVEKKLHIKKKTSPKDKNLKKKNDKSDCLINEESQVYMNVDKETVDIPVKPTINIINGNDWTTTAVLENSNTNKSKTEEQIETPEMDRLSLQNPIGSKLNISDLLETPYKQVLYDIQMETPRFLGPDIPGEPMSDIKIMNIPTPRFLDTPNLIFTPKPVQATPSSYSSRPTDYSSGGSYYKPDDQDYIPEGLGCPVTSTLVNETPETLNVELFNKNIDASNKLNATKSRPVRQCTKNVSYYNSPNINIKNKDLDDKIAIDTLNSGHSINLNSSMENKKSNIGLNVSKDKSQIKVETKKKRISSKKRKSPKRKEKSKPFMKIKPRRPTPTKEIISEKNKTSESLHNVSVKLQTRRRTVSKEKNSTVTPIVTLAPTKSRRKSSTPRKLHCTKAFNPENSNHNSQELICKSKHDIFLKPSDTCTQDSDTEQLALRWSDDGSQDANSKESEVDTPQNETDHILEIREYIETTDPLLRNKPVQNNNEGSLHIDLIKRGFDIETAKIIERDLLDTPSCSDYSKSFEVAEINNDKESVEKNKSDCSAISKYQEADETDEIELSVQESNENSKNYITIQHDNTNDLSESKVTKLKDKFSMEVCIDDGVVIRLRATPFSLLLDQDPIEYELDAHSQETELAVRSISTMDKLYTPMKDSIKAQCYEIFDSTLTSLDTPLKVSNPQEKNPRTTITEIVLEVEQIIENVDVKQKMEAKKRKRLQSGSSSDESLSDSKRAKPETEYLLNSTNIQNIDIESVLSKLHGP